MQRAGCRTMLASQIGSRLPCRFSIQLATRHLNCGKSRVLCLFKTRLGYVSIWRLMCYTAIRKQAASNIRGTIRLQQTEPGTSGAQPAFFNQIPTKV